MWNFLGAERQINKVQEGKFCILEFIEIKSFSHLCVSLHHNVSSLLLPQEERRPSVALTLSLYPSTFHPSPTSSPFTFHIIFTRSTSSLHPPPPTSVSPSLLPHLPPPTFTCSILLHLLPRLGLTFRLLHLPPLIHPSPPSSLAPPSEDIKLTVCD